jgi:hypothetical protein
MPYGLLAAAFLAVRVQGSHDGGRRAMPYGLLARRKTSTACEVGGRRTCSSGLRRPSFLQFLRRVHSFATARRMVFS